MLKLNTSNESLIKKNQEIATILMNSTSPELEINNYINSYTDIDFLHILPKSFYSHSMLDKILSFSRVSLSDLPLEVLLDKDLLSTRKILEILNTDSKKMSFLMSIPEEIALDTDLIISLYDNFISPITVTTNPNIHSEILKKLIKNPFFKQAFKNNVSFSVDSIFAKDSSLNSFLLLAPNILDTLLRDMSLIYSATIMKEDLKKNNIALSKYKTIKF